jgi:hypothetical protein
VAIDQTSLKSLPDSTAEAAIENEFPTYRAISSTAVLSLFFGVAAVFCYADLWFLLSVAAAVILGLFSLKKIRRFPEVLTGAGLARLGIGIGLLFGLTSVTRVLSQDLLINLDAGQFAKTYIEVIKNEPVSVALWYQQPPAYRKAKNPDDLVEELKKGRSPAAADAYEEKAQPIVGIKDRLKGKNGKIQYDSIETRAIDGLTTYANALIKVEGPGTTEHPETEMFALLQMVKGANAGRSEWVVSEVKFPYTPKSAVATVQKKDDDGHGHSH